MTADRFDPNPGEPYGLCRDCGEEFTAPAAASAHMSATNPGDGTPSHAVNVLNPTRESRLRAEVGWRAERATEDLFMHLQRLVDDGDATAEEIGHALRWQLDDIDDAWREWVEDDQ